MPTWRDGVVAFGWLALFHAANIVVLTVCVLLALLGATRLDTIADTLGRMTEGLLKNSRIKLRS